jgi:anti-sigma factor RsiW
VTCFGRPIGEDDLQAHVDGRLPPDRLAKVEAYLRDHPAAAERIAAYRMQCQELRNALSAKAREPMPARLRVSAILANRRLSHRRTLKAAAAAFFWLALGSAVGWFANEAVGPDLHLPGPSAHLNAITQDAVSAHRTFAVEVAHPVEVPADQRTHLARWIAKRLGRELLIPDLSGAGLRLLGGRVLPAGQSAAAQLMYEDEHGMRVTLYVRVGENGETSFRFSRHDDVLTFYWIDDGCAYLVSAATDRGRLLKVAETVFNQLETSGGIPKPTL